MSSDVGTTPSTVDNRSTSTEEDDLLAEFEAAGNDNDTDSLFGDAPGDDDDNDSLFGDSLVEPDESSVVAPESAVTPPSPAKPSPAKPLPATPSPPARAPSPAPFALSLPPRPPTPPPSEEKPAKKKKAKQPKKAPAPRGRRLKGALDPVLKPTLAERLADSPETAAPPPGRATVDKLHDLNSWVNRARINLEDWKQKGEQKVRLSNSLNMDWEWVHAHHGKCPGVPDRREIFAAYLSAGAGAGTLDEETMDRLIYTSALGWVLNPKFVRPKFWVGFDPLDPLHCHQEVWVPAEPSAAVPAASSSSPAAAATSSSSSAAAATSSSSSAVATATTTTPSSSSPPPVAAQRAPTPPRGGTSTAAGGRGHTTAGANNNNKRKRDDAPAAAAAGANREGDEVVEVPPPPPQKRARTSRRSAAVPGSSSAAPIVLADDEVADPRPAMTTTNVGSAIPAPAAMMRGAPSWPQATNPSGRPPAAPAAAAHTSTPAQQVSTPPASQEAGGHAYQTPPRRSVCPGYGDMADLRAWKQQQQQLPPEQRQRQPPFKIWDPSADFSAMAGTLAPGQGSAYAGGGVPRQDPPWTR
ncbi:uncharacterized protein E0L32_005992 [Thyridium curvatum]|uniref:Uncharacterized protein n=1 Tax=Thyridium curvatum TaxID=1093900 RepID=A0A507B8Y7_9PEZI|nr:uncharacterized protein E0L32_005992 [Thyridium curvatum]TPX13521.1 hypothetical protein E0L32_005992 [Thyridium curvatum]